ncbi:uncharacterized protein UHOD_12124 [Ustilago sp. UG-2017b]|nr:uncharacterized protein UHOD_12124 [Ustilago sp. UG-2017b]
MSQPIASFGKMVAKFCDYHQKESFVNPEQKRYLSMARASWQRIKTIYYHLTHKQIDYNIALEALALITEESIHKAKPKPVAHYLRPNDDDNELMEDDSGMLVVRDSGHEVQPSQHRQTQYCLGCEVTFHNLKGGQTDPNIYQTQPLYDSGSPACMEPTIILAQLAKEDGIFDHGISIASVMETADPEYFEKGDEFLPIPIKAKAKDRFVLRAIELASSSGRGTTSVATAQHQSATSTSTLLAADNNGPTSGSNWVISELAPWTTYMSGSATRKIALATGMPKYTMYSLRCMTIQMLDHTSVTEGAKRLPVGHLIASSQIVKSYLSRCNVVDIQGLVQRGKESRNHIMLHGLCHVKAITDTPNSLHAVANAGVKSMLIIQRLVREYNQAKVALSDASAQGLPAHEYQALKVDHDKKMQRLEKTQRQLRCQTMIEQAYKEKEDLNVCALCGPLFGGVGPAAAAQELSQQLQAGGVTTQS